MSSLLARGVVVSQPVHQHSYETAVALDDADLLHTFVTGLYDTRRGLTSRRWIRRLPPRYKVMAERELGRRRHPNVDPGRVLAISQYHLLELALRRGLGVSSARLNRWAQYRFDAAVARRLRRLSGVQAVHAFEGGALETFRTARSLGLMTVLDVPAAHEEYRAVLEAEDADYSDMDTQRIHAERELADWFITPSDFVDECLIAAGVPKGRLVQIPYGVDLNRFGARDQADNTFRVLFVGSIGARKGVSYLLDAWADLALPNAELVLVGAPDAYGREAMRKHAGLFRHVPNVPKAEVAAWYRSADAFVFPTLADGYGLVLLEAMAAALPVVTTPNCGAAVRDGVDGFVVPPRDSQALSERIRFLYDHQEKARRMGASGRDRIRDGFTWSHYAHHLTTFYRDQLAQTGIRQQSPDIAPQASSQGMPVERRYPASTECDVDE